MNVETIPRCPIHVSRPMAQSNVFPKPSNRGNLPFEYRPSWLRQRETRFRCPVKNCPWVAVREKQ